MTVLTVQSDALVQRRAFVRAISGPASALVRLVVVSHHPGTRSTQPIGDVFLALRDRRVPNDRSNEHLFSIQHRSIDFIETSKVRSKGSQQCSTKPTRRHAREKHIRHCLCELSPCPESSFRQLLEAFAIHPAMPSERLRVPAEVSCAALSSLAALAARYARRSCRMMMFPGERGTRLGDCWGCIKAARGLGVSNAESFGLES